MVEVVVELVVAHEVETELTVEAEVEVEPVQIRHELVDNEEVDAELNERQEEFRIELTIEVEVVDILQLPIIVNEVTDYVAIYHENTTDIEVVVEVDSYQHLRMQGAEGEGEVVSVLLDVLLLPMEVVEVELVALTLVLVALHEETDTNEFLFLDTQQIVVTI